MDNVDFGVAGQGDLVMRPESGMGVGMRTRFDVECYDRDGNLKWRDHAYNTVVNAGLNDLLDKYFKGSTYTAAFYVGITDHQVNNSPSGINAADTMSSHSGWTEATGYTNGSPNVRPTLTLGTVSSQSVDNSASKASFSIDTGDSIGGFFITTDNTIGGTSGTLYGVAGFTGGNRTVADGDTLNVTVTLTAASA